MYALICTDKEGGLEIRQNNRDRHLEYLANSPVVLAGPFQNAAGEMIGSLIVLDLATSDEAEAWAAQDPYAAAGLFKEVRIEKFKKVIG